MGKVNFDASVREMTELDLDTVLDIEIDVYSHPWTRGNFSDSLNSGCFNRLMVVEKEIVGYSVSMLAADEIQLLNFTVKRSHQRRGYGGVLLQHLVVLGVDQAAKIMSLEVRRSNVGGVKFYSSLGFVRVGLRKNYYPTENGREHAIIMERPI